MPSSSQQEIERRVREAADDGDFRLAATLALSSFGGEIMRFLRARLRDGAQAEEAYLQFSEDLWVGLPAFRWESSLRVWMFVLARNSATRVSRGRRREVEFGSERDREFEPEAQARTGTARFMRTEVKDRMREIRHRLAEEDQTLLILRIDRGLEWRELAVVMNEVPQNATDAEKERAAARLRTRFQTAKKRLRTLAEAEGILPRRTEDERPT